MAYFFLLAPIGHLVGIEVGGHGHGAARPQPTPAPHALWALRAGVFVVGAVVGWFAGILVNRAARRVLPRRSTGSSTSRSTSTAGWSPGCCASASIVLLVYAGLMVLTVLRLPSRARRLHSRAGQGLPGPQCAAARRRRPRPHRQGRPRDEQDRPRSAGRRPHDRPARLLGRAEHEHQQRRRHVRHPRAVRGAGRQSRSSARRRSSTRLREKFSTITAARVGVFGAPPVEGLGSTGGFKLQVQDRRSAGLRSLAGRGRKPGRRGQPRSAAGRPVHAASASPSRSSTSTSTKRRPRPRRST